MEPSGRLELTWANKHLRLISDPEGGYEWVDPTDPRVSEVRLLHDVDTVGDDTADGNLLIEGDALHALTALNRIPELAQRYAGQVRLVYIDPPFNTGQAFAHYDDNLEHSVWLSMLRDRLVQLKPLLAPNGSIWVHLDDAEVHRCRVVMDEVLGSTNFIANVVWQKKYSRDNRPAIGAVHDHLLVYALRPQVWTEQRNRLRRGADDAYRMVEPSTGRLWRPIPLTAQAGHATTSQFYEIASPSGVVHKPPKGRCWTVTEDRFWELHNAGRIYWGKNGDAQPNLIGYLDEAPGLVPWTWWPHTEVGNTDESKKEILALSAADEPFGTPKPERLMERIIHISTNPGDIVLDCFAGSGATAAVAHKMGRRWVTSEREPKTIATFTRPRLEKVVNGEDPGGISSVTRPSGDGLPDGVKAGDLKIAAKALLAMFDEGRLVEVGLDQPTVKAVAKALRDAEKTETETVWRGGGGFRHLRVGPSMFDLDAETGDVYLAEWATNGVFSEAVAAQLGFERVDEQPFCGRKGRTRLAVLDGVVGEAEVEFLVAALDERERVVVVGQAFTEEAEPTLRRLSPGSKVRHAPHDLLRGSRR